MREDIVQIAMEPIYTGIVVMRPHANEQRGLLLLNVAETEGRIRFLPGFLSASFLVDPRGVVAEYLRWRSAADVGAAFKQPAFFEHLPVLEPMSEHPTVVFGSPAAVLTSGGESAFTLSHENYAMTVLRCKPAEIEAASAGTAAWCRNLIGRGDVDAVALHIDREGGQLAVLAAGGFDTLEPPEIGVTVREHLATLRLYGSVTASDDPGRALRYSMVVQS